LCPPATATPRAIEVAGVAALVPEDEVVVEEEGELALVGAEAMEEEGEDVLVGRPNVLAVLGATVVAVRPPG
jgi:hypothetical protein